MVNKNRKPTKSLDSSWSVAQHYSNRNNNSRQYIWWLWWVGYKSTNSIQRFRKHLDVYIGEWSTQSKYFSMFLIWMSLPWKKQHAPDKFHLCKRQSVSSYGMIIYTSSPVVTSPMNENPIKQEITKWVNKICIHGRVLVRWHKFT